MQQLKVEHKKITSKNQKTEPIEGLEIRREKRIPGLINSRRMYKLELSNVFYIESSTDNIFYYCRYMFGSESKGNFCSCKDFEYRGHQRDCLHLEMIPMGIMKDKIVDVPALPEDLKRDSSVRLQYESDDYDF